MYMVALYEIKEFPSSVKTNEKVIFHRRFLKLSSLLQKDQSFRCLDAKKKVDNTVKS